MYCVLADINFILKYSKINKFANLNLFKSNLDLSDLDLSDLDLDLRGETLFAG